MENADSVIFLNEFDMNLACGMKYLRQNSQNKGSKYPHATPNPLRTKSYLSVVPPLIQRETILPDSSVTPNQAILVFGMFRMNKGFEEGVALAIKLKELGMTDHRARNIKVILAGSLITSDVAKYCVQKKY